MQDAQTLRRNFLWNTFGQLTYMLCQFLCGILVVRLAGEQVSGVYNTALTATGIFLSIASYGMYSFQVSDIRGKYGASTYIRSRVWTCALAVALCIGFVAVSALTGENPYSAQQSVCVLLFLGYRMVESLTDIYNAIDQRSGRLDIGGKTYAVRGAVTLASFTLTLWLTQDIVLTLALMLGASLVVFFVYSLPQARAFYAPEQPQNARVAALLWECLPLAVYSFLNTTTASIPKLALSSRMGETALGIYGPVTQPVVLLQVGATYLFNPFITVFADSYARRDKKGFFKAVFAVQGIVLALFSTFMWKVKHNDLFHLMIPCGISSTIFGLVYGSLFGYEEALDPLYHALGMAGKPVSVMDSITGILMVAVYIGIVLVLATPATLRQPLFLYRVKKCGLEGLPVRR